MVIIRPSKLVKMYPIFYLINTRYYYYYVSYLAGLRQEDGWVEI